jgi:adenosine kinase
LKVLGQVRCVGAKERLAIVAPDGKEGMLRHARECAAHGIPFLFDPGQGLPMFTPEELAEFLRLANYVAVNDYEGKLLEEKTGRTLQSLARDVKALVVTLGAQGSRIYAGDVQHEIPSAQPERVLDPTGCGDAYRAGLLYGIAQGWDWPRIGRLGAVLGALKIASRGAQNHHVDRETVEARYRQSFRESPWG